MANLVLVTLSLFLGLNFAIFGTLKVTPHVHREFHRDQRRDFVAFAKVFPLSSQLSIRIPPKEYRLVVGYTELVCGVILALIPRDRLKCTANIILLLLKFLLIHAHYAVSDKYERVAPSLVFALMLMCRLVVQYQVYRRQLKQVTVTSTEKSTPVKPVKSKKED